MGAEKSKRVERRHAPARLDARLEKSLSAYAVAAAAAGVSLLAMARSAEAKIVYTAAKVSIPVNGGPVLLDLNHDGVADFTLSNFTWSRGDVRGVLLQAGAKNKSNEIWGAGQFFGTGQFSLEGSLPMFASALHAGFTVGPNKAYFQKGARWLMGYSRGTLYASSTQGQWLYTQRRYLGLKFIIGGQPHYGWARLTVQPADGGLQATLTGYAYETIPNKPIIAGKTKGPDVVTWEPATLGRLAQGASGISAWREKK
jgi:hypothetical protein